MSARAPYSRRRTPYAYAVPFTPDERPCRRCDHPLSGHITTRDAGPFFVRVCLLCQTVGTRCPATPRTVQA